MRLIDADKLDKYVVKDIDGEYIVREKDIITASTVEAIPIEWIISYKNRLKITYEVGYKVLYKMLGDWIEDWRKENV